MTDQLIDDRLAGVEEGASIPGHGTSSVAVRIDRLSHLSEDIVRVAVWMVSLPARQERDGHPGQRHRECPRIRVVGVVALLH